MRSIINGMEKVGIKIVYHTDQIEPLRYIDGKSDWIDLRAAERVELKKGDWHLIRLGVSMELPAGYEAHVVPRSSTYRTWGLLQTNSCGVIDNSYCATEDEWMVPMLATRDTVVEIGDRICQFRIMKNQPAIVFETVTELTGKSRGGFGSTGKK